MKSSIKSISHAALKKVVACVTACALGVSILGLAGCASSNSATQGGPVDPGFDAEDIQVTQSGYTMGADGTLRYAFVAVNPNDGHLAENVVFSIQAYDSGHNLIAGAGSTMPTMYPQHETAACGSAEVHASVAAAANAAASSAANTVTATDEEDADGAAADSAASGASGTTQVAYLEITPVMDSIQWSDTTYDSSKLEDEVKIENPRMSETSDDALAINAEVTTTLESANMQAVALVFDGEGNPIYGSDTVDFECGVDNPGNVSLRVTDVPDYTDVYIYVTPTVAL